MASEPGSSFYPSSYLTRRLEIRIIIRVRQVRIRIQKYRSLNRDDADLYIAKELLRAGFLRGVTRA